MANGMESRYVVVGGGTSGNVIAARLAAAGEEVLVLEAGPDFGPFGSGAWPADLLDATRLGHSHDWGYDSGDTLPRRVGFERARVIGGCSDVNGTTQTWGHRRDYDDWAAAGNDGWSADELRPLFTEGTRMMRVKRYRAAELTPWQRAWYDAGTAIGLPRLETLNDLDQTVGFAPEDNSIVDGIRWNTAFAYLDPVRELPSLRIAGQAPGVGENLHDQPFALMSWAGTQRMAREMGRLRDIGWAPDEQAMAKAASSFDPAVFDLHFLPYSPTHRGDEKRWSCGVAALQPRSRGHVRVRSRDPEAKPLIDHRFLSDAEGHDARALAEGMEQLRAMAAAPCLSELVGAEIYPGPVHGVAGLWVADCSIMPKVPRATTAMPAVVIGERIARFLLEDHSSY
jgi:choline dehydrogenase-like flavoprotein